MTPKYPEIVVHLDPELPRAALMDVIYHLIPRGVEESLWLWDALEDSLNGKIPDSAVIAIVKDLVTTSPRTETVMLIGDVRQPHPEGDDGMKGPYVQMHEGTRSPKVQVHTEPVSGETVIGLDCVYTHSLPLEQAEWLAKALFTMIHEARRGA